MPVTVPIDFTARFDEAEKAVKGFADKTSKQLSFLSATSAINAIESAFNLGSRAAGAFVNIISDVVGEAAEAEAGMTKLAGALQASGDFSEQNIAAFKALSEQIAETTNFTDDAVIASATLAKQFTSTNKQTAELVKSATNLAEATGVSLEDATRQLGQTLDGTAGRLGQLIPELQLMTKEQLKSGAAIDIVNKKFKDFAEKAAGTFSGQIAKISKNFAELKEDVGTAIISSQALVDVIKVVNASFKQLREFVAQNSDKIAAFVKDAIIAMVDGFGLLVEAIRIVDRTFTFLYAIIKSTFTILAALAKEITGPIVASFAALEQAMKGNFAGAAEIIKAALTEGFTDPTKVADQVAKDFQATLDGFTNREGVYNTLAGGAATLANNIKSGNDFLIDQAEFAAATQIIFDNQESTAAKVRKQLEAQAAAAEKFKKENEEIAQQIDALQKALKNAGKTDVQIINETYQEQVKFLEKALSRGKLTSAQFVDFEARARIDAEDKLFEAKRKNVEALDKIEKDLEEKRQKEEEAELNRRENFLKKLKGITADPFSAALDRDKNGNVRAGGAAGDLLRGFLKKQGKSDKDIAAAVEKMETVVAGGLGIGQNILGGAAGAKKLIGSAASAAGQALFGPAGEALGPIAEALSAGPEEVKKMVQEFAKALPDLIENVVRALPVVIEELAKAIPEIVDKLVDRAPEIIEAMVKAAPRVIFAMIQTQPKLLAAQIRGAIQFAAKIIQGAGSFVGKVLSGAVRFIGEIIRGAGRFVGELVKQITKKLGKIGGGGGGFGLGGNKGLLGGGIVKGFLKGGAASNTVTSKQSTTPISGKAGAGTTTTPQQIVVPVNIGNKQLAQSIVDVQKLGYKLVPA